MKIHGQIKHIFIESMFFLSLITEFQKEKASCFHQQQQSRRSKNTQSLQYVVAEGL